MISCCRNRYAKEGAGNEDARDDRHTSSRDDFRREDKMAGKQDGPFMKHHLHGRPLFCAWPRVVMNEWDVDSRRHEGLLIRGRI